MCMKDRLCKMSKAVLAALCLLATCGLTYSCSDDYDLDETTPPGMGPSIYDFLAKQKNFKYTVRLIEDLSYKEVLQRTGSKTLFIADDAAYDQFFQNNTWGVSSYDQLSKGQKSLLLSSAMLNNAYLLEMLANTSSTSSLTKNTQLRQVTSASVLDSVPYLTWDSGAIPVNYSEDSKSIDYWKRFRTQEKGGILLAMDGTTPMMTHFIAGQLGESSVTDQDFEVITGTTREKTDAHIYASKVIDQDHVCMNGYVNQVDRVLVTPANMAELVRSCGKTNIFSHLLDRFSAPYYNSSLTSSYRQLNGSQTDSVFEKRYFSGRSKGGSTLYTDPLGNTVSASLSYDPGWNQYYPSGKQRETDMGAMFVPSDEVLSTYFLPGGAGDYLMENYATKPNTSENLLYNLDQIPDNIIQSFIDNLLQTSYENTVPSKYITVMNDAKDPMFSSVEGGVDGFISQIDTCLLANNGVVYIMNKVYAPADYAAVSSPALISTDMKIFNWAIHADDKLVNSGSSNAPLNALFSFYLKAMSSRFSFFIPTDEALGRYYDLVTTKWNNPEALSFFYDSRTSQNNTPVQARRYSWDPATMEVTTSRSIGTIKVANASSTSNPYSRLNNRLIDLLDSHIIVHSGDDVNDGLGYGNQYYITKGGSAVKILNMTDQTQSGFQVQGGFQIDIDSACNVLRTYDRREETSGYGNGMAYVIDRPIQTTTKSVYSVLNDAGEASPFYQFAQLCNVDVSLLQRAGVADDVDASDVDNELNKYTIFTTSTIGLTDNVRFFNAYRYTVYVPTNEAVLDAESRGLPTWEEITQVVEDGENEVTRATEEGKSEDEILAITTAYKTKAQAMITCLINFLKYHFQDNSVFADVKPIEATDYETACLNDETKRYRSVQVSSTGNGTLSVRPVYNTSSTTTYGPTRNVVSSNCNIMTRDYVLKGTSDASISAAADAQIISSSSYAVVHLIDGVLDFKTFANDRYDSDWSSTSAAKKFISKYRIRK